MFDQAEGEFRNNFFFIDFHDGIPGLTCRDEKYLLSFW